jgi:hypothetical protein
MEMKLSFREKRHLRANITQALLDFQWYTGIRLSYDKDYEKTQSIIDKFIKVLIKEK